MSRPATDLIGIDWGTSNVRAFRYDARGAVIERRASEDGIAAIGDRTFAAALAALTRGWIDPGTQILMSGMIGSRNGWMEVSYLPCPVDPADFARGLIDVPTDIARCRIVPGLRAPGDVMRGEETQIVGAGLNDGCVVLPGTHSKWAWLERGRVERFRTAMTGELYRLLLDHSLLGKLAEEADGKDDDAFARGVTRSLAEPSLITTLFSARAEVLVGGLAPCAVPAYLSGLLIGAEVAALATNGPVTLIGEPALSARYRATFALAGIDDVSEIDGAAAAAAGLWRIAREAA